MAYCYECLDWLESLLGVCVINGLGLGLGLCGVTSLGRTEKYPSKRFEDWIRHDKTVLSDKTAYSWIQEYY